MIVDTSALVAIFKAEPEARRFVTCLADADGLAISSANYLECSIVVDRIGNPQLSDSIDELIANFSIAIVAVTESQARIAREAYRRFGKHSGHPARLNFGDCFAYALAIERGEPLLYKGDDFSRTDVTSAG